MNNELKKGLAEILGIEALKAGLNEDAIIEVLKRRLTKKERKLLFFMLEGMGEDKIKEKLNLDDKRAGDIKESLYIKIKHPKIRNVLVG